MNFKSDSKPKYVVRCMKSSAKVHIYLMPKSRRREHNGGSLLRAAVYDNFENAQRDAAAASVKSFQIVPVGYAGPAYWDDRRHVRHDGPSAQYQNPRVFLVDPLTGNRIEV